MKTKIALVSIVIIVLGILAWHFLSQKESSNNSLITVPDGWINTMNSSRSASTFISYISPDSNPSSPNAEIKIVSGKSSESLSPEEIVAQNKSTYVNAKNFVDRKFDVSGIVVYEEKYDVTDPAKASTSHHKVLLFTLNGRTYNISGMYKEGEGDKYAQTIESTLNSLNLQ